MPSIIQRKATETRVWARVSSVWPLFTRAHDIFNDPGAVEGLLLGDFLGWRPYVDAQVMDIGANAGIVSAWCALYGATVTAYEADPVTADLVRNMAASTGLSDRLTIINAAIWSHDGTVPYHGNGWDTAQDGRGRNGAIQVVGGGVNSTGDMTPGLFRGNTPVITPDVPRVPCVKLSTALSKGVYDRWDFVKMDIEGAEFQVLLSTPDHCLACIDFLQIEFHNGWADDILYQALIDKLTVTFDHTGSVSGPADEYPGRYHYGHFRNRTPSFTRSLNE
jgi:FkbM family methyltransferase